MASRSQRGLRLLLVVVFVEILGFGNALAWNTSDTGSSFTYLDFNLTIHFLPDEIKGLIIDETTDVYFTVEPETLPPPADVSFMLRIESADPKIAQISANSEIRITVSSNQNYTFTVKGKFLGRTTLKFFSLIEVGNEVDAGAGSGATFGEFITASPHNATHVHDHQWDQLLTLSYPVAVIREERVIDVMFIAVVSLLVVFSNIGMGCKIELKIVKEVLRRPVSPVIGFFCQFIVMPSLAYALTIALALSGGTGLGFFATGCAPGGGASNMYTFLFDADVSLSVTMTLISVITAFGMIPLWLLTLGQKILDDTEGDVKIPFQNILISLATIIIPVGIGLLIQKKKPPWAKKIIRCLTPFFVFFILFMCTAGVYSNLYLFRLFSADLIIACILLPWVGFFLGGVLATVFRQSKLRILTIAIETAIQNTGIPIILTKYSLPQPEADLSVVAPVMVAMFTPVPLWIALGILEIRKRRCKNPEFKEVDTDDNRELNPETDSNENETLVENGSAAGGANESKPIEKDVQMLSVDNGNTQVKNHSQSAV